MNLTNLTAENILDDSVFTELLALPIIQQAKTEIEITNLSNTFGLKPQFKKLLSAHKKAKPKKIAAKTNNKLDLEVDFYGNTAKTINNLLSIMSKDTELADTFRYNELAQSPEKFNGTKWREEDDSIMKCYIENTYRVRSGECYDDAFRIVLSRNSFNPITDMINKIVWDGKPRIKTILQKWLKCINTPYTSEVARLIFAGGINRAFEPGCKFDDMPVIVGKQGAAKSTFIRWLAMDNKFFTEVSNISGQQGIEALQGAWICEIGELLALTKLKEVEEAKAYITRLVDSYRKPYERRKSENPRRCVFIGSTNKNEFLTDNTGNRRYYPVFAKCDGYDIFDNKTAIKHDIAQCWAEAKAMYDNNNLKPYADKALVDEIQLQQMSAVEDDYRIGMIDRYIEKLNEVCAIELWETALKNGDRKPYRKESNEIVSIMNNKTEWYRTSPRRTKDYGNQRLWIRREKLVEKIEPKQTDLEY